MDLAMLKQVQSRPDQIPLNNLPQWSRVNNLDRARYPKPFTKDGVQPSSESDPMPRTASSELAAKPEATQGTETVDLQKKVQVLENTVSFLKRQHREVLEALHEEVDRLKRQNHELQFQIAMWQTSSSKDGDAVQERLNETKNSSLSCTPDAWPDGNELPTKNDDVITRDFGKAAEDQMIAAKAVNQKLEITGKQKEVEALKKLLKEQDLQNALLREELAKTQEFPARADDSDDRILMHTLAPHPPLKPRSSEQLSRTKPVLPFTASVEPLQVRLNPRDPRPPTLQECEAIIGRLVTENGQQAQELGKMKSDLREVLYTHKWTPDSYLLAKSYLPDDDSNEQMTTGSRDSQRQSQKQPRKLPALVSLPRDRVFLPPLNHSINYRLTDRRPSRPVPKRRISSEPLNVHVTRYNAGVQ